MINRIGFIYKKYGYFITKLAESIQIRNLIWNSDNAISDCFNPSIVHDL